MADEKDPNFDLEAEVESLRAELATQRSRRSWLGSGRAVLCALLLVLVVVLAPLCVVARWTHSQIADTDKYVDTVAPLAENPDVQAGITRRITTIVFQYVDVSGITEDVAAALSERGLSERATTGLEALSVPIEGAVQNFVEERVQRVVESDAFAQAWVNANREAHTQMVAALTGDTEGSVQVSGDEVTVNLSAFIDTVKQTLIDQGFRVAERIPPVDATFVVFNSSDLSKAQRGFHLLDVIAVVLPVITLLLIGAAVLVARSRRKALIASGLCVALGMILLGLILTAVRPLYLDSLPATINQDSAAAVYDILIGSMRRNLRIVLVVALLVSLVVWCTGPARSARRLRSTVATGSSKTVAFARERARGQIDTGSFGHTLWDLRTPIRIAIIVIAVFVLLSNSPLSAGLLIWTILIALVAWFVLDALSTPSPEAATADGPDDVVVDSDTGSRG
jgi:hypothetical protein